MARQAGTRAGGLAIRPIIPVLQQRVAGITVWMGKNIKPSNLIDY